jgi:hypothetical protein
MHRASQHRLAVGSGQWAVGSGQWAVGRGQRAEGTSVRVYLSIPLDDLTGG